MISRVVSSITMDTILDDGARLISPLRPRLDRVSVGVPDPLTPHDIFDRKGFGMVHDPFGNRFASGCFDLSRTRRVNKQ